MQVAASVLGDVRLLADGQAIELGGPRQRRLLAALLVHRGSAVGLDQLVEVTFGAQPPDGAWRTFRTYVARLRRALDSAGLDGAAVVVTVPSGYALASDVTVDADRFDAELRTARDELDVGDPDAALSRVEDALALWTGSAYGEFADEEWARPDAVRLEELRIVGRELRATAMVDTGRHEEAIAEIRAIIEQEPLRETPRRLLTLALYRSGRHAEALRALRRFGSELAEETGLEMSTSLAELEQMVIDRDPRLDGLPRGRKLRGYVLREMLAETPHGTTYRASQPAIGRDVAITVIPPELADDAGFVRRFERHAQRIASIEHPTVVPLYDYWREPGGAYVVTRYLGGGSLASRFAGGATFTSDDAARIIDDIGAALSASADRGVAHGRLTPETVLFDESGRAHLTGFVVEEIGDATQRDVAALVEIASELSARVATVGDPAGSELTDRAHVAERVRCDVRRTSEHEPDAATHIRHVTDVLTAALRGEASTDAGRRVSIDGPNPYRGLHSFQESDTEVFFGRRAMVDQMAADLRRDSILALVGPSGSGKSSVVRAGLLARMRASGVFVTSMTPGRHPIAELEVALARVATTPVSDLAEVLARPSGLLATIERILPDGDARLLLCIDQLEEAVTMSDAAEREAVFAALAAAVRLGGGVLQVVVTLRADFLGRILDDRVFGPLVRDHSRLVTPLDSDELYEAIVEPAALAGVAVEPELATALVADAIDSPGSLPLLQFALTELYERRVDGTMTLAAYRRLGALATPIAQRAEEIYSALTSDDQDAARRLFARLITLGEGAEDSRRRVPISELATVPASVLDVFGAARLLTFDRDPRTREPTVEIAHEALIRGWPRLRSWMDDDRAGLLVLRHLTTAATAWVASGRDPGELYRGSRLAAAEEWSEHRRAELTPVELEFLLAGLAARRADAERDRTRARRLRVLSAGLGVVAVLALVAGMVALVLRDRADANARAADERRVEAEAQRVRADANARAADERRVEAEAQRALADASAREAGLQTVAANVERLTAQATSTIGEDPDLPILLALAAYDQVRQLDLDPPGSLLAVMQTAVQSSRVLVENTEVGVVGDLRPDGTMIAARSLENHDVVVLIDADSGEAIRRLDVARRVTALAYDGSGSRLALAVDTTEGPDSLDGAPAAPSGGAIVVVDARTFAVLDRRDVESPVPSVGFSPDGRHVSAILEPVPSLENSGRPDPVSTVVWDLDEPSEPLRFEDSRDAGWTADSRRLMLVSEGVARYADVVSGEPIGPVTPVGRPDVAHLMPTEDGDRLVLVRESDVEIWEVGASEPLARFQTPNPTTAGGAIPASDGSQLVLFGSDDDVQVIDLETEEVISLPGNRGSVARVSMSADGSRLLAPGSNGTYLWDLSPAGPPELGNLATEGDSSPVRFTEDGSGLMVEEVLPDGTMRVRVLDVESGDEITSSGIHTTRVAMSDDGLVAVGGRGPGSHGLVEDLDGSILATIDGCSEASAMDGRGRWLALTPLFSRGVQSCPLDSSRIVDPTTGNTLLDFEDRVLGSATFGPSGTIADGLIVGGAFFFDDDGRVAWALEVWDVETGQRVGALSEDDDEQLWRPFFSADGRYITVGSGNSGAYAIDVQRLLDGSTLREAIALNPEGVGGVATFPDAGGGWLVAGQSGEVLRFWDLATGTNSISLPVDTGRSTNLRFAPDGSVLYYESRNGVLRRFPMDHADLAVLARRRAQRDFTTEECERFAIAEDCSIFSS